MQPEPDAAKLAAIPTSWAQPDPSTICYIPKGGVELAYMGHGEVTLAPLDIDPLWTWEPLAIENGRPVIALEGKRLVMWARLTLCGKSILGVGTCEASKFEPEKELIGDFLRNGAMRFGVATKLWSKATVADAAGSGPAGGYDRTPPLPDPVHELWKRVEAAKDTPTADVLKAFAKDNNRKLSEGELARDSKFADQIELLLNTAVVFMDRITSGSVT